MSVQRRLWIAAAMLSLLVTAAAGQAPTITAAPTTTAPTTTAPTTTALTTAPTTTPAAVNVIERSAAPTVGTEGRLDVVLPYEDLRPAPANSKADLVLRVVEARRWGTGFRYDVRDVAAVPGEFDLVKYLRRGAEETPPALPPIPVTAKSVLPDQHDGALEGLSGRSIRGWRWYWPLAIGIVALWALSIVPLVLRGRSRHRASKPVTPTRPPTMAERLRPLVLSAASGTLDAEGQAGLERLLIQVWRRRLSLGNISASAALHQMRRHPEAGPLLLAVEDWLHRRPGTHVVDEAQVNRLLAPYAQLPDEAPAPHDLAHGEAR